MDFHSQDVSSLFPSERSLFFAFFDDNSTILSQLCLDCSGVVSSKKFQKNPGAQHLIRLYLSSRSLNRAIFSQNVNEEKESNCLLLGNGVTLAGVEVYAGHHLGVFVRDCRGAFTLHRSSPAVIWNAALVLFGTSNDQTKPFEEFLEEFLDLLMGRYWYSVKLETRWAKFMKGLTQLCEAVYQTEETKRILVPEGQMIRVRLMDHLLTKISSEEDDSSDHNDHCEVVDVSCLLDQILLFSVEKKELLLWDGMDVNAANILRWYYDVALSTDPSRIKIEYRNGSRVRTWYAMKGLVLCLVANNAISPVSAKADTILEEACFTVMQRWCD